MQINLTTDYAIRTLLYLAKKNNVISAAEISKEMGIRNAYVLTITRRLRDAGMIKSYSGVNGGHKLAKQLSEISLLQIVELMEGTIKINRCLEDDHFCSRDATSCCPVRKMYQTIQENFESTLKNVTLQTLMEEK